MTMTIHSSYVLAATTHLINIESFSQSNSPRSSRATEKLHEMASVLDNLLDMGFDKDRAELAVKQTGDCKGPEALQSAKSV